MSNLVKFGSYTEEAAKAEAEELDKGSGEFMRFEVGKNVVRFLPPPVGRRTPFVIVQQHYIQLPGMASPASFNCPRVMARQACPACSEVDRLRLTGNPVDFDNAKDLLPKKRIYANVIDRKHSELGPRVAAYGVKIHDALTKIREDGDFTHPIEGFDIVVNRVGQGKNDTEYDVRASRQNSQLAETAEQMNNWIEAQKDVVVHALVPTPDMIARILNIPSGGGISQGAAPSRAATAPARRGQTRTASDDLDQPIDTTGESADDFPPGFNDA
jgi:hypothetical protein